MLDVRLHVACNHAALRDASGVGVIFRDGRTVVAGNKSADRDRTLSRCVHEIVGTAQLREDERPALQACCITHRRNGDVDVVARMRERRQKRRYHHRCDVARLDVGCLGGNAERLKRVLNRLTREERTRRVAASGEADDEPVADELVTRDALNARDIFEPHILRRCSRRNESRCSDG